MSSSESGKSSILKFVPEERMVLRQFLLKEGVKDLERRVILVNGQPSDLNQFVERNDEIIVLPKLKGG
ncbi:MAG: hypothetical protein ACTSXO_07720 [Candidatus Heimdallarchaeota archaeon]|nr:MAG: hypothetical protein DRO63_03950 [Candidatus Gerdarchaeota archaeon]RLI72504.1 MAG: hypothetical protein DRP02_01500 [Candidatus Gerdarchaeota archaeon]RLI72673.1 MAG: hypothetical protein DRO91_04270 [Candidatus Heimdallarchaeota archaeon]